MLMSFDTLIAVLDYSSVFIFALTGALVAARGQLDPVGFIFFATLTGIGGGTLRDMILGRTPVFWINRPELILLTAGASAPESLVLGVIEYLRARGEVDVVESDADPENVHFKHFLNITWVNEPVEPWAFTDEEMWGAFWKKYNM